MQLNFYVSIVTEMNMHQFLGPLLAAKRREIGHPQMAFSEMTGLSVPTIRNLERGKGNVSSYIQCLNLLGVKLCWQGSQERGIGKSLAHRRTSLGISQRQMATRLDVSHRTVIALENAFRGRIDTLEAYLDVVRLRPRLVRPESNDAQSGSSYASNPQLQKVLEALPTDQTRFALLEGDALAMLRSMPSSVVDCVVTSPPYWRQRSYAAGGIGEEQSVDAYLTQLRAIFRQVHRVLTASGSLWLNIDDTYQVGSMQGIPWRLVLGMVEDSGWLVRNDNIWAKSGGSLNRSDRRLTHQHEHIFHLVKRPDYYFDADAIRIPPKLARHDGKQVVAATGLTKAACYKRIAEAMMLSDEQRSNARTAVSRTFDEIEAGDLHDFRLILKGRNRVTHSDVESVSSRAAILDREGFYILRYHPMGSLPRDVWNLAPERTKGRYGHYAAFPESLCELPLLATCPAGAVVLDPFVGTGTTLVAAQQMGRHGIGIDLSAEYLEIARQRLEPSNPTSKTPAGKSQ